MGTKVVLNILKSNPITTFSIPTQLLHLVQNV